MPKAVENQLKVRQIYVKRMEAVSVAPSREGVKPRHEDQQVSARSMAEACAAHLTGVTRLPGEVQTASALVTEEESGVVSKNAPNSPKVQQENARHTVVASVAVILDALSQQMVVLHCVLHMGEASAAIT